MKQYQTWQIGFKQHVYMSQSPIGGSQNTHKSLTKSQDTPINSTYLVSNML